MKVPFKSDSELLAIISSIGFGLEKEHSIKKLENQKIVYGRKLLNMGFRSTAATYKKWRHELKRLGTNKQFILELEDTYGDILYVSEI